jgi:hypothetical protein
MVAQPACPAVNVDGGERFAEDEPPDVVALQKAARESSPVAAGPVELLELLLVEGAEVGVELGAGTGAEDGHDHGTVGPMADVGALGDQDWLQVVLEAPVAITVLFADDDDVVRVLGRLDASRSLPGVERDLELERAARVQEVDEYLAAPRVVEPLGAHRLLGQIDGVLARARTWDGDGPVHREDGTKRL